MPELDLTTVPASLVATADVLNRNPKRAMEIIQSERRVRELALMSVRELKRKRSWNPGRTAWMALLIGSAAFSLAFSFDTIMSTFHSAGTSIGGTMKELSQLGIELPSSLNSSVQPLVNLADKSQPYGLGGAIGITFVALLVYGVYKFLVVSRYWGEIAILKESEQSIQGELDALNIWMNEYAMNAQERAPVDRKRKVA